MDGERTAENPRALSDADQPEAASPAEAGDVESHPLVRNPQT
jgi:hypothetical protein